MNDTPARFDALLADLEKETDPSTRALGLLLRANKEDLPFDFAIYDGAIYGKGFHKAFRQVYVTDSANVDMAIWHLMSDCRPFWKLWAKHMGESVAA